MPDASRGVPVWHEQYTAGAVVCHCFYDADPLEQNTTPGTWYPVALAEARERVIEAARAVKTAFETASDPDDVYEAQEKLIDELVALDALEGADTEGVA